MVITNDRPYLIKTSGKSKKPTKEYGDDYYYDWSVFYDSLLDTLSKHNNVASTRTPPTQTRKANIKTTTTSTSRRSTAAVKTSTKAPRQRSPVTKVQASNSSACKCGISKVDDVFQLEISGGDVALPHQFPWMVRLINGCRLSKFFIELTKSKTELDEILQ